MTFELILNREFILWLLASDEIRLRYMQTEVLNYKIVSVSMDFVVLFIQEIWMCVCVTAEISNVWQALQNH